MTCLECEILRRLDVALNAGADGEKMSFMVGGVHACGSRDYLSIHRASHWTWESHQQIMIVITIKSKYCRFSKYLHTDIGNHTIDHITVAENTQPRDAHY